MQPFFAQAARGLGLIARLLALSLALAACATPVERQFRMGSPSAAADAQPMPVWPQQPMVPRYMYVGELLGEQNYGVVSEPGFWGKVWRVITGTDGSGEAPIVLQRPQGGAVDDQGRILVTDVSRQAAYLFDPAANNVQVWEWAAEQVRFKSPIGAVADNAGGFYVCDSQLGYVAHLDATGTPIGTIGASVLQRPTGIARDPENGDLYVADTDASNIKVFDTLGNLVRIIGQSGDGRGALNRPTYITFAQDRLYVADTLNSRVEVFDREGEVLTLFGQRGLYVGNLSRPKGIAVDDEGNIYVIESYFDYLLVYDDQGRMLLPIGGTGSNKGQFYLPAGVWIDRHNRIYVADMFNGRVSVFQFLGGG